MLAGRCKPGVIDGPPRMDRRCRCSLLRMPGRGCASVGGSRAGPRRARDGRSEPGRILGAAYDVSCEEPLRRAVPDLGAFDALEPGARHPVGGWAVAQPQPLRRRLRLEPHRGEWGLVELW